MKQSDSNESVTEEREGKQTKKDFLKKVRK